MKTIESLVSKEIEMKVIRVCALLLLLCLAGCAHYLITTNFHTLSRGMTKQQFLNGWQANTNSQVIIGGSPASSRTFSLGDDLWEVWIYNVYNYNSVRADAPYVDHQEHVAFKNGLLEEWGLGTLPITISENPNRIEVDVKMR